MIAFAIWRKRQVSRIAIVTARLWVETEGGSAGQPHGLVGGIVPGVTRVRTNDGIAACERRPSSHRIEVGLVPERRNDFAVIAAIDLMQEAAVPVGRKSRLELNRIRLAVKTDPFIDFAAQNAVLRQVFVGFVELAGDDDGARQYSGWPSRRSSSFQLAQAPSRAAMSRLWLAQSERAPNFGHYGLTSSDPPVSARVRGILQG